MSQREEKFIWIKNLVLSLAFAAGIIMSSVGGIMVLSSGAKLLLFQHNPYTSYSFLEEQCKFEPSPAVLYAKKEVLLQGDNEKGQVKTEEEIRSCIERKQEEERNRYQQEKLQSLIDGLSSLFVGLILIIAFYRELFPKRKNG